MTYLGLALCLVGPAQPLTPEPSPPPAVVVVQPAERYYMVLFGAQSVPFQGRYTHTWATFVRTQVTEKGETPVAIDTTSWMPKTLNIRPLALRPEPGANLTLEQTFKWVATFDGRVSKWGPYEIDRLRYAEFMERKAELESGTVQYRAIGGPRRRPDIVNCGQSFARGTPEVGQRYLYPTPSPGENGTGELAERYLKKGDLLGNGATHEWIFQVINADQYPSTTRQPGEKVPYLRR